MRKFETPADLLKELMVEMGPDPMVSVPRAPDHQNYFEQVRRESLKAAERSLTDALADVNPNALASFVHSFDEDCYRYLLFSPLRERWKAGVFTDRQWGGALRALLTSGHTTSGLLGIVPLEDVIVALSEVAPTAIMRPTECNYLRCLASSVVSYRAGWARSPEELARRGLSWSLSQNAAAEFLKFNRSEGMDGHEPFLLEALINRESILCFFDTGEEELVVDPGLVPDFKSIPFGRRRDLETIG